MSTETDRLAVWLRDSTPEPPHRIHVEDLDLVVGSSTRPQRRHWLPVLAAACVLALAIALVVALDHGRATPATHPRPSYRLGLNTTPPPNRPPAHLVVTPWQAQAMSNANLRENSLIGYRGALYAIGAGSPLTIARIDPRTGSTIVARLHSPSDATELIAAGGLIWTFTHAAGQSGGDLNGFDPAELQNRVRTFVDVGADDDVRIAASADGALLYVGSGKSIRVFDASAGALTHTLTVDHPVHSLAASPNAQTLYAVVGSGTADTVLALDPMTGATRMTYGLGAAGGALQATNRGFFVTASSGNASQIEYFDADDPKRPVQVSYGGGGVSPAAHISGGVVWTGGNDELTCTDPELAVVRSEPQLDDRADISGITAIGRHVYAIYNAIGAGTHALIELHPPDICGLR